ncbi:DUF4097 family beta strand repeat-containing protein [Streptomyces sp. NPDC088116]|uniref:DUF4097 family beta strand repeat-containing protein n=1 Tax=Streptomyces sp. NPDC088116 TaxID=3365825 RepID=UPI00381B8C4E
MATRRNRTRTLLAVGGAALLVLSVSGCGGADASDAPAEKKSFPLSGKTLTIDAGNSAVDLVPADVKAVEVTRRVDGWVVMGNGPHPRWKMTDGTLTLDVKCSAVMSDCVAQHEVRVPRGVAVTVNGDNGGVRATGFDTPLRLKADNGAMTVRDSSGPLDLESDNGKITAEGITAKALAVKSGNGAVRIGFSAVPDSVDATSDNGGIEIDLPRSDTSYAVKTRTDNGKIDVDVPTSDSSSHVVKARTDNGKIAVRTVN